MQRKNIKKEDLKKIKVEILQVLEETFDWPGLFEKVWPEGRFAVTDTLLEFFKIPKDKMAEAQCFAFDNKIKISNFRVLKVVERIFDDFVGLGSLPFWVSKLNHTIFVEALIQIQGAFARNDEIFEIVDFDSDDIGDEKDTGHEPGMAY